MVLKALYLNTSLKSGDEESNTGALMKKSMTSWWWSAVETEILRVSDYNIKFEWADEWQGDQWLTDFHAKTMDRHHRHRHTDLERAEKQHLPLMESDICAKQRNGWKRPFKYYNKYSAPSWQAMKTGPKKQASWFLPAWPTFGFANSAEHTGILRMPVPVRHIWKRDRIMNSPKSDEDAEL